MPSSQPGSKIVVTEKSYSPKKSKSRTSPKVSLKQIPQSAKCTGCNPAKTFPSENEAKDHMLDTHYKKGNCTMCRKEVKPSAI